MGLLKKIKKVGRKAVRSITKGRGLSVVSAVAGAATGTLPVTMAAQSVLGTLARPPRPGRPSVPVQHLALPAPSSAGLGAGGLLDVASKVANVVTAARAVTAQTPSAPAPTAGAVRYPVSVDPAALGALGTDKVGRPLAMPVTYTARARAPRGYVVVQHPTMGTIGMLRGMARAAGLWRPKHKPPISVGDWRAISRAERAKSRVGRVATLAGWSVSSRGRRRSARRRVGAAVRRRR